MVSVIISGLIRREEDLTEELYVENTHLVSVAKNIRHVVGKEPVHLFLKLSDEPIDFDETGKDASYNYFSGTLRYKYNLINEYVDEGFSINNVDVYRLIKDSPSSFCCLVFEYG